MPSGLRAVWAIVAVALVFWFLALYPLVHLVRRLWVVARDIPVRTSGEERPRRSLPIRWAGYCCKVLLLAAGALFYGLITTHALLSFIYSPRSWLSSR